MNLAEPIDLEDGEAHSSPKQSKGADERKKRRRSKHESEDEDFVDDPVRGASPSSDALEYDYDQHNAEEDMQSLALPQQQGHKKRRRISTPPTEGPSLPTGPPISPSRRRLSSSEQRKHATAGQLPPEAQMYARHVMFSPASTGYGSTPPTRHDRAAAERFAVELQALRAEGLRRGLSAEHQQQWEHQLLNRYNMERVQRQVEQEARRREREREHTRQMQEWAERARRLEREEEARRQREELRRDLQRMKELDEQRERRRQQAIEEEGRRQLQQQQQRQQQRRPTGLAALSLADKDRYFRQEERLRHLKTKAHKAGAHHLYGHLEEVERSFDPDHRHGLCT